MTIQDRRRARMRSGLGLAGTMLMTAGIAAILFAWWGVAHTGYTFEQIPYVVSGGILGVGLIGVGGFLYFGSWLTKLLEEQRQTTYALLQLLEERDRERVERTSVL
ncbi:MULTISPECIES: hypothetical protein [Lentzea]|uniref:Uncharacterized protein n=2 Tax=Lentzea TaxID=165301 RepID=A0ABQ3M0Q1_9PSEU|nr:MULTISPECIES: hypothetical protein [Lentzea]MDX3661083.1 hypothetical protein [Streptomyces sp. ID05-26A]GGN10460.1 hypothetical protein GCM10011609_57790 [Lentzea pudingi]GHH30939.1 hypothetical protein GCM10017774_09600 [Lentzea cavernae]